MANTLLSPSVITDEALRILHQKTTFIRSIDRQYDSSFAKDGAKIGSDLKIRLPNKYTVTTGAAMSVQDTTESSVTLTVATQKHVAMNFTTADLTLTIDDFSERYIEPAISVLAADLEADALSMYKDVYQFVDDDGAAFDFDTVLAGRQKLNDALAPLDKNRHALLSNSSSRKIVDATKSLFNAQAEIASQYRDGAMGRAAGLEFAESSLILPHTTGTAAKTTLYTVNGANQTGSSITIQTGTTTFLIGDVVTFAGCNRCHPETKSDTGELMQFVVTANSGANATTLAISPSIVTSGATQNVTASPTNSGAVVKVGAGASETLQSNLVYHKNAFAFATADLIMPKGVDFSARRVFEGISMRIIRQYDINNDKLPCRIDVLYGKKCIRPELAVRVHADG